MAYCCGYESPIGKMIMRSDGHFLTELDFMDEQVELTACTDDSALPVFALARRWLDDYFQGGRPDFMLPVSMAGTPFQHQVWEMLGKIPYGTTVSYGEIAAAMAKRLAKPRMSAQAVGSAVGRNPIAIIVPCHRVVGKDGSLTGYAGGLWRKEYLLALERRQEVLR